MPKVIFFTSLVPKIVEQFLQHAPADYEVGVHSEKLPEAEKIILVKDADFLLLFPSVLEDDVLKAATRLKLIQLVSAGFDKLNLDLIRAVGVPLANNGGTNSIDVAEHTLALMLGFYRRMLEMDRNSRNGNWKGIDSGMTTHTIHGKTVGIIGLGNIGRRVAQRLAPFGARLLYYDEYPPSAEIEQQLDVTRTTLDDLLQQSDIVTVHVPLMESTYHLLGERAFGLMKSTALVVNTCRGPVVDEAALTVAINEGQVAGAALDVLEQEPPEADNPILTIAPEKTLFSPHIAGVTFDTWTRRGEFIFQNFQRVQTGEAPLAKIGG